MVPLIDAVATLLSLCEMHILAIVEWWASNITTGAKLIVS